MFFRLLAFGHHKHLTEETLKKLELKKRIKKENYSFRLIVNVSKW